MRGSGGKSGSFFRYLDPDERVPKKRPLRLIRAIVNDVLAILSSDFASAYSAQGLPLIAPRSCLAACFRRPSIRSVGTHS